MCLGFSKSEIFPYSFSDTFAPFYYFSHKNHRPKGWWWFCCGVRLSPLERRDKEKNTKKKNEGFGRVQKRKYSTTAKNTIRKSEKRAQQHQQSENSFKKPSLFFCKSCFYISFTWGGKNVRRARHKVCSVLKALFYSRPSPLLLPEEKHQRRD